MKTEQKQLLWIIEPLIVCVIFAALYAVGGSGDFWGGQKWIRRFLAPALFSLWAFLRSGFDWRYLVQMPFMLGALTLPYGADNTIIKILLRGVFGLANGTATSIRNAWHQKWAIVIGHILLVTVVSVSLGVWNQTENAMAEQFLIGLSIVLIPAFTKNIK